MRAAVVRRLVALLCLVAAPAAAQSRVHVGGLIGVGIALPLASAAQTYDRGPIALGAITVGAPGSPLAFRAEALYCRMPGERFAGIPFPAVRVLAFTAGIQRRLGSAYAAAGLGPYNFQYDLPYARYSTRLGVHASAGFTRRVSFARAWVEGRLTEVTGASPTPAFVSLVAGVRIGR